MTGKRQDEIHAISGFDVPRLANSDESRLILTVAKIFKPDVKDIDKKSYLIWIIPLLAVAIFLVNMVFGVIGVAIFAVTVFKLKTTDLDKVVLQIKIGVGLWLILWSYLGIGIASILRFFALRA